MSSYPPDLAVGPAPGAPAGPPRRRTARILLIVGLVVVLAAAGTAAGAEAYFRRHFQDCIASQTQEQIGSKVSVHFGAKPLLLTAIDHKVGSLTMDSDDAKFGPAVGMKVHVELHDIKMVSGGNGSTVGSSSTRAEWSDDGIAQTLTGLVSGVQSSSADGTLEVKVLGGIGDLKVRPHLDGDKIAIDTESVKLLGVVGLPTDLVDGIVKMLTQSLQTYPLDQHPTEVKVTDSGIQVKLAGGATSLNSTGNSNQNSSNDIRC